MEKLVEIQQKYEELTDALARAIESENDIIGGCILHGMPDAWKDQNSQVGHNAKLSGDLINELKAEIALIEPEYVKLLEKFYND